LATLVEGSQTCDTTVTDAVVANINDANTETDYVCAATDSSAAVSIKFDSGAGVDNLHPSSYSLTTASTAGRDPKSWRVECKTAAGTYVIVDTQSNVPQVTERETSYGRFPLPTSYLDVSVAHGTIYRTNGAYNNECPGSTAAPDLTQCTAIAKNIAKITETTTEYAELQIILQAIGSERAAVFGNSALEELAPTQEDEAANPVGCYMKVPTSATAADNGKVFYNANADGAASATAAKICCEGSCAALNAYGDPHLTFAHGGTAHFRGVDHGVFNFLSAPNVSFNVEIEDALYNTAFSRRTVNGSFMTDATWVIRTATNKSLFIKYSARVPDRAYVWLGAPTGRVTYVVAAKGWLPAYPPENTGIYTHGEEHRKKTGRGSVYHILPEDRVYKLDDVTVAMPKTKKLLVETSGWAFQVKQHVWYPHHLHPRLSVSIRPKYDVESPTGVAPHGLIGQTWDRDEIAISGAVDDYYSVKKGEVFTTKAQAEGAIEGTYRDYLLSSPFGIDYRYSRFYATGSVPPRNVSELSGKRASRVKNGDVAHAVSVPRSADAQAPRQPSTRHATRRARGKHKASPGGRSP